MRVDLGPRSYDICIGEDWLPQLAEYLPFVAQSSQSIMITDRNVFNIAGRQLLQILGHAGFRVEAAVIAAGEDSKNLATTAWLYEQMVAYGLDRKSTVFALGGGIVGDIAGFVAATYMRGIPFVQIPTTLLAQVDSSVGGKTGVNLPLGKNLVGSFHQPSLVFVDVAFLKTLPDREYLTGLAEVIKYGVIWDEEFFGYLERQQTYIMNRDPLCLQYIINRCCTIKAEIVAVDETETGIRALLNLGHTFGHALESLTRYQLYTHGEAVAIGMVLAARLACNLQYISKSDLERIIKLIGAMGLPTEYKDIERYDIIQQMYKDKKNVGGHIQLILPTGIGTSKMFNDVTEEQIESVLI
jgi:3-dehydroquinate synthase